MDGWGFAFLPCPPSPEQPPGPLLPTGGLHVSEPRPLPLLPPPSPRPPEPHAQPHGHESNHQQRLQGLCKHGPGQQEQAHAAEDDGRGDPRLVGAVEVRFAHAQHDEAEDGQEVEGVAGDAVEGDERVEGAGEDVDGGEARVEDHGGDRGEEEARVLVGEVGGEFACLCGRGRRAAAQADRPVLLAQPDGAEERRHVALLPRGVDEPPGSERRGVERAEAASRDEEGEDQGASRAEDLEPEGDGDGVGGLDDVGGEDEEVGDVGEDVAEDHEGERGVDDAGEVAGGVLEFGGYVAHIVPAVKGPQPRVQGDGPVADVVRGAVEPALLLPVGVGVAAVGEACDGDHDADDEDAQQRDELEEHEEVGAAGAQLGGHAVQRRHDDEPRQRDGLVQPGAGVDGLSANGGTHQVLAEDDGDDGGGPGLQHRHGAPGEQEARPLAEDLGQVHLRAAVEWNRSTELGIAGGARPRQHARDSPDDQRGARRPGVLVHLGGRREDAAPYDQPNDQRQAVEVRQALVLLERAAAAVEGAGRVERGVRGGAECRVALGGAGEGEQVGRKVEGGRDAVGAVVSRAAIGVALSLSLGGLEQRILVVQRQSPRRGRARGRRVLRGAPRRVRRRGQRRELEGVAGRRGEVGVAAGHGA
ncbi:hypothetical protein B5807_06592 [Epicoccum nigrum]|uniref:Uncharacterized protein n=1 Tax=Epicoccum nigrum TaxID=105696 RepID=A0A1Y2LVR7_EPING|nr:hypothetical protein B5807_06592 [Epicoccum nigrum]